MKKPTAHSTSAPPPMRSPRAPRAPGAAGAGAEVGGRVVGGVPVRLRSLRPGGHAGCRRRRPIERVAKVVRHVVNRRVLAELQRAFIGDYRPAILYGDLRREALHPTALSRPHAQGYTAS